MKNITVSVDDATYRAARIKAAELGASVSKLVREYLVAMSREETDFDRLRREEAALRERVDAFKGGDRLDRADLHDRR